MPACRADLRATLPSEDSVSVNASEAPTCGVRTEKLGGLLGLQQAHKMIAELASLAGQRHRPGSSSSSEPRGCSRA